MKITVNVDIKGLELKFKYIREGAQQGLSNTVFEAALLIEKEAKDLAPVRTGYLRDHIKAHMAVETPVLAVADIVSEADYSAHVEYGTNRMSARPFMRPAFEAKKQEAIDYIVQNVKLAIAEEIQAARR